MLQTILYTRHRSFALILYRRGEDVMDLLPAAGGACRAFYSIPSFSLRPANYFPRYCCMRAHVLMLSLCSRRMRLETPCGVVEPTRFWLVYDDLCFASLQRYMWAMCVNGLVRFVWLGEGGGLALLLLTGF